MTREVSLLSKKGVWTIQNSPQWYKIRFEVFRRLKNWVLTSRFEDLYTVRFGSVFLVRFGKWTKASVFVYLVFTCFARPLLSSLWGQLGKIIHCFVSKYLFLAHFSIINKNFLAKMFEKMSQNKFLQTDTECEKKNSYIQCQQVVKLYQNFLAFSYFLEETKKYQFGGGAICSTNHLSQDRWWQIRKFFPSFSVILM